MCSASSRRHGPWDVLVRKFQFRCLFHIQKVLSLSASGITENKKQESFTFPLEMTFDMLGLLQVEKSR